MNVAVILAGGSGSRMGAGCPKQFLRVAGKTLLEHSVDAFSESSFIDRIAIVSNPDYITEVRSLAERNKWPKVDKILAGGKERCDSSLAAIAAYSGGEGVNLILHDAVRPLVSGSVIADVAKALESHKAVGVAVPVVDTIIVKEGDFIESVPARDRLWKIQTPQAFRLEVIAEAFKRALCDPEFKATDDCGVVVKYMPEVPVYVVRGEESNIKLTYRDDLAIAESLFCMRKKQML